jgi:hypothetical protein
MADQENKRNGLNDWISKGLLSVGMFSSLAAPSEVQPIPPLRSTTDSSHVQKLEKPCSGQTSEDPKPEPPEEESKKVPKNTSLTHGMPVEDQLGSAYEKDLDDNREKREKDAETSDLARNTPTAASQEPPTPLKNQIIVRPKYQLSNNCKLADNLNENQGKSSIPPAENNEQVKA